jgi:prepilin-type processing-associated H-X9-DG protein
VAPPYLVTYGLGPVLQIGMPSAFNYYCCNQFGDPVSATQGYGVPYEGPLTDAQMLDPARVGLILDSGNTFDGFAVGVNIHNDGCASEDEWFFGSSGVGDANGFNYAVPVHDGGTNFLFADGHAEWETPTATPDTPNASVTYTPYYYPNVLVL